MTNWGFIKMKIEQVKEEIKTLLDKRGLPTEYDYKIKELLTDVKKELINKEITRANIHGLDFPYNFQKELMRLEDTEEIKQKVKEHFSEITPQDRLKEVLTELNYGYKWAYDLRNNEVLKKQLKDSGKNVLLQLNEKKIKITRHTDKNSYDKDIYISTSYLKELKDLFKIVLGLDLELDFVDSGFKKPSHFTNYTEGGFIFTLFKNGSIEIKADHVEKQEGINQLNEAIQRQEEQRSHVLVVGV